MHVKIWALFCLALGISDGARILGIVPTPSYSHQVALRPIWKSLSLRGHQVTLITTDPIGDPSLTNLTEIDIRFSYKHITTETIQKFFMDEAKHDVFKIFKMFFMFNSMMENMTIGQLEHPPIQDLLKNESVHFDLVMVELMQPALLAFGRRFNCPTIGMLSLDATFLIHEALGNPTNPALYPDLSLPFEGVLSFGERMQSLIYWIAVKGLNAFVMSPTIDRIVTTYFGPNFPSPAQLLTNMDMLFLNANPILNSVRPVLPSVVYFGGGTHLEAPKSLPKDVQDFLDSADEGFVYFSLGSNVKSKDIPERTRRVVMETLSELPYKVLWKFEADELPGKPANVKIHKWLPQQDVLRHPNIKLFITQGGLQSMEEALFTNVPMVVMPFMGDQDNNARKVVLRGYGLSVDRRTIDKDSFKEVIFEVINNEKYRKRIKEVTELALDRPISGIDSAIWWTEYVVRHKGAKHFRSHAVDMPLYQYLLLDVIGVIVASTLIVLYIVCKSVKFIVSLFRKSKLKTN